MQVLTQYHAEVKSFPLSIARIGILRKGRYSGFDLMIAGTGTVDIPIAIKASTDSVRSLSSANAVNAVESTVLTAHGVVIKSPDTVQLSIAPNLTSKARWDRIYLEYLWEDSDTPSSPFIGVISNVTKPFIGIPPTPVATTETQVTLGTVYVPAGATSFGSLIYYPEPCPLPGDLSLLDYHEQLDLRYAQLDAANTFTGTQVSEPAEIGLNTTAEVVAYTGNVGNYLLITNNYKALTLTDIQVSPGVPHHDGTRLTLIFANLSASSPSYLKRSTNGHAPGFDYNTQGIFGGPYFPIKNADTFEVILDPGGTWRIINATDSYGGRLLTLWSNLNTVMHQVSDPIIYTKVSENASADTFKFSAPYSSSGNTGYDTTDRLKFGINRAGLLEITGGFSIIASVSPGWSKVFTLPSTHNFQRKLKGFIHRDDDGAIANSYKPFKIDRNGDVWVEWDTQNGVGTWWVMNVIMSIASGIAPLGNGLPALW